MTENSSTGLRKPRVFIGSSTEGLRSARYLHQALTNHRSCTPFLWEHGVFGVGQTNIASLIDETKKSEFAVLVLTPDDEVLKRGEVTFLPRDNVIFELGLFMGTLGLGKTYIVYCREDREKIDILSDLHGVVMCRYNRPPSMAPDEFKAEMGSVALDISDAIDRVIRAEQQAVNNSTARRQESCYSLLDKIVERYPKGIDNTDLFSFQQNGYISGHEYGLLDRELNNKKFELKQQRSRKKRKP